jgi:hypothetical protein
MTLDPEAREEVIQRAAQLLADKVASAASGIEDIILIDLSTVAQCLGTTRKYAARILPITHISERVSGVRLSALKTHLNQNTKTPQP